VTAKEKIIAFMEDKQKLLSQKSPKYFGKRDERDIMKWSDEEAERVWNALTLAPSFGTHSCPFCLHYSDCDECSYGKRHGICGEYFSDYDKLCRVRVRATQNHKKTKEFYKKWENENH
jgi:hypothetical protein